MSILMNTSGLINGLGDKYNSLGQLKNTRFKKILSKILFSILIVIIFYLVCFAISNNVFVFKKVWFIIISVLYFISTYINK